MDARAPGPPSALGPLSHRVCAGVAISTGMSRVRCDGWRAGAGERLARSWWTISERPFGTRLRCVTCVYLSVYRLSVPLSDSVDVGVLLYDVARVGPGFMLFSDRL